MCVRVTKWLHTDLRTVEDAALSQLVDDLCHCVGWPRDDAQSATVFYLLSAITVQDRRSLAAAYLPGGGILTGKVGQLPDGAVRELCAELAALAHEPLEAFAGRTVIALIARCFPKPPPPRKATRNVRRHEAVTQLIRQRRANGSL